MQQILKALHDAKAMRHPTVILARTVKGKGVTFMEDNCLWHGAAPNSEELAQAMREIEEAAD